MLWFGFVVTGRTGGVLVGAGITFSGALNTLIGGVHQLVMSAVVLNTRILIVSGQVTSSGSLDGKQIELYNSQWNFANSNTQSQVGSITVAQCSTFTMLDFIEPGQCIGINGGGRIVNATTA